MMWPEFVRSLHAHSVLVHLRFTVLKCVLFKDRVGGRVATFRKGNYVADLGAMVVTGLGK